MSTLREPEDRRRSLSLLTPRLRRLLAIAMTLAAFMVANTIYLLTNRLADAADWSFFADADTAIPKLFQAMVASHTGVGLTVTILLLAFGALHLPKVWKRRRRRVVASGVAFVSLGIVLAVTGLFILTAAASRNNAWAWWAHVACAALVPLLYGVHRGVSFVPVLRVDLRRFVVGAVGVWVALIIGHGFTNRGLALTEEARMAIELGRHHGPGARARIVADHLDAKFVPTGFVPPASPFFPSAATTTTGDYLPSRIITRDDLQDTASFEADLERFGFIVSTKIGAESCDRCHPDIVEQWSRSAHRFASFNNPFYEATINDMRENATESNEWVEEHIEHFPETADRVGMIKSKWCSACHDPALMLAGKMNLPVDRRTPEAQAGLTCLACHAIDHIHDHTGNGNYNIADEQEDPYLFATAPSGSLRSFLHDLVLKAKPTVHKRQMKRPFFTKSEFCATCHKVSLNVPVNNYRWLRGQNEFDNWHDSGVSLNASRTFYLPAIKRECQDCHMPFEPAPLGDVSARDGKVRSHRFLAANTALPFVRGDEETVERIERFLQDEKLSVDVFAVKTDRAHTPVMAVEKAGLTLAAGESFTVDVVVRNKGVGHTFPGGTNDSNEGWLEVSLLDERGKVIAISGFIQDDGHLDPDAHLYKAIILDKAGRRISRRNAQDIHVNAFARVIGPGTADAAHFRFTVPEVLAGQRVTVRARLLWRKFDRLYTEFAYKANPAGFKGFDTCPDLPVTEIAADDVAFEVVDGVPASPRPTADAVDWMRYNDYGIGLLLQGDTRGAVSAFDMVARVAPERIDGPRNLARVAIRDGNIAKGIEYLKQCEELKPADAQTAWFWGVALQEDGRYEQAVMAYVRVLEQFPEDRATWRNMGLAHRLNKQFELAIVAFDKALEIDPEDRIAHYHKIFCLRALRREREAEVVAAAYDIYKIDESAQRITQAFRLEHRGVNLETQPIHVHDLTGSEDRALTDASTYDGAIP